jgi:hypothetical protein
LMTSLFEYSPIASISETARSRTWPINEPRQ